MPKRVFIFVIFGIIVFVIVKIVVPIITTPAYDNDDIPEWSGEPSVELNKGKPEFSDEEIVKYFYEVFSERDRLGREGVAMACLNSEHMAMETRTSIGMIKPSGWRLDKYDFIDNGGYLYNRCHLIGWQPSGNNNELNLITGTRYLNTRGMLPYENKVATYIRQSGNHVMYRVTPVFVESELVARGIQIEAYSVEDKGEGVSFNVYCFNVQPHVIIDYKTGESKPVDEKYTHLYEDDQGKESLENDLIELPLYEPSEGTTYILNINSHRFHKPDCSSIQDMSAHNREESYSTREELIDEGYKPCGACNP